MRGGARETPGMDCSVCGHNSSARSSTNLSTLLWPLLYQQSQEGAIGVGLLGPWSDHHGVAHPGAREMDSITKTTEQQNTGRLEGNWGETQGKSQCVQNIISTIITVFSLGMARHGRDSCYFSVIK